VVVIALADDDTEAVVLIACVSALA